MEKQPIEQSYSYTNKSTGQQFELYARQQGEKTTYFFLPKDAEMPVGAKPAALPLGHEVDPSRHLPILKKK